MKTTLGQNAVRLRRAERVRELRNRGFTGRQIANQLDMSQSYVYSLLHDPTGEQERRRKESYAGRCQVCGRPTSGANGRNLAPRLCYEHYPQQTKYWTRERVLDAIQRFAQKHGRPPNSTEWVRSNREQDYPPRSSVYRSSRNSSAPFAKWADAIEAAGFPRPKVGVKPRARKVLLTGKDKTERARIAREFFANYRESVNE